MLHSIVMLAVQNGVRIDHQLTTNVGMKVSCYSEDICTSFFTRQLEKFLVLYWSGVYYFFQAG
jgi:hypothetical protein